MPIFSIVSYWPAPLICRQVVDEWGNFLVFSPWRFWLKDYWKEIFLRSIRFLASVRVRNACDKMWSNLCQMLMLSHAYDQPPSDTRAVTCVRSELRQVLMLSHAYYQPPSATRAVTCVLSDSVSYSCCHMRTIRLRQPLVLSHAYDQPPSATRAVTCELSASVSYSCVTCELSASVSYSCCHMCTIRLRQLLVLSHVYDQTTSDTRAVTCVLSDFVSHSRWHIRTMRLRQPLVLTHTYDQTLAVSYSCLRKLQGA